MRNKIEENDLEVKGHCATSEATKKGLIQPLFYSPFSLQY